MERTDIIKSVYDLKCEVLEEIRKVLPNGIHYFKQPFYIHYIDGEVVTTETCKAIEVCAAEHQMAKVHHQSEGYGAEDIDVTDGNEIFNYEPNSFADILGNLKADIKEKNHAQALAGSLKEDEQHDFDDAVKLANAELMQNGLQIVLKYDGVMYWSVGIQIKATNEIKWHYMSDFEYEVRDHVFECWENARTMAKELAKADSKPKMWCVTYVGLSDSEYKANGYSDVALYTTKEAAKAKLKAWRDDEIAALKKQEQDYEILEDEDDECRIGWSGYGEQVRIEIHEVELDK